MITIREWKRFIRLARLHWAGSPRDLLHSEEYGANFVPCFVVLHHPSWKKLSSQMQAANERECAERSELAGLYDRIQAAMGSTKRAVRQ